MEFLKVFTLGKTSIQFNTNSPFFTNLLSKRLIFNEFKPGHQNSLTIYLNFEEIKGFSADGRADNLSTVCDNLSFQCWLKSIDVRVQPEKNLITAKAIIPTVISDDELFDLLIIHPLRYILKYKDACLIHAAALAKNNQGVLICGRFQSGKSTLAVKLVEDGFKFLSDEFAVFDKKQIFPFPLKTRLERNSINIFPRLRKLSEKIGADNGKVPFDMQEFYSDCPVQSCLPKIIIFLEPHRKAEKFTLKPINTDIAYSLLCKDENNLSVSENLTIWRQEIQHLTDLTKNASSYYLIYSLDKIDRASKAIEELLISNNS